MSFCLNAQNDFIGFGFRAGLSLSKIDGPSELGPGGEELETNKYTGGFHIGAAGLSVTSIIRAAVSDVQTPLVINNVYVPFNEALKSAMTGDESWEIKPPGPPPNQPPP